MGGGHTGCRKNTFWDYIRLVMFREEQKVGKGGDQGDLVSSQSEKTEGVKE